MNNLNDLIKAAEERGAAERLLRAGKMVVGELGAEIGNKAAELDESGSVDGMRTTVKTVKTATNLVR